MLRPPRLRIFAYGLLFVLVSGLYLFNFTTTPLSASLGTRGHNQTVPVAISKVLPDQGYGDIDVDIYVIGSGFVSGDVVALNQGADSIPLATYYLTPQRLWARIPAGQTAGLYNISVTTSSGAGASKAGAYTILAAQNDDLLGFTHEFWSDPNTFRVGEDVKLGLLVHRVGGKDPLANVSVRFSLNAPVPGGTSLGNGTIPLLSPRSVASTSSVIWRPDGVGQYTLYAVIDQNNAVNESFENNNVISRTVTVYPGAIDSTPPMLDLFTIDDGAFDTRDLSVDLALQASDPSPDGGVQSIFIREYFYSQGAERWLPIQESGWLSYADVKTTPLGWSLFPTPGAHILLAWTADLAGNISAPVRSFINYVPPSDTLGLEQVRTYRYLLKPGHEVEIDLLLTSGDSDLYVWPPDYKTRPLWSSILAGTAEDSVSFTAPIGGVYQVDVHGYEASVYQYNADISEPKGNVVRVGSTVNTKPERMRPLISLENDPDGRHNVPTAPAVADRTIHLPVIQRNR